MKSYDITVMILRGRMINEKLTLHVECGQIVYDFGDQRSFLHGFGLDVVRKIRRVLITQVT